MIKMMPEGRQRVAFLKWGEDWSSAEIAELMGISQSTVRAHLKLARDELTVAIESQISFDDSDDDTDEGVA
jgi:RNA polymerase sigma-70 factor (ECF subfamily)